MIRHDFKKKVKKKINIFEIIFLVLVALVIVAWFHLYFLVGSLSNS